jgi:thiol-disulfide isomerase/thioredoxin
MNSIINTALSNSISYQEYRDLLAQYAIEGKTSGNIQTSDYVHYTKLNESRMHRLDKTMQVIDQVKTDLENLTNEYIWVVLSETWCGDAAQVVPVLNKMAQVSNKIELRILFRDQNETVMDLFLTNGTKSIPKLIILHKETGQVVADFGPRPMGAKQLIIDYKTIHGFVDETAKIELQKWYLADKGVAIQREIMALMRTAVAQKLEE